MDGGPQQEEMAEKIKRDIKANAFHRREERAIIAPGEGISGAEVPARDWLVRSEDREEDVDYPMCHIPDVPSNRSDESNNLPRNLPACDANGEANSTLLNNGNNSQNVSLNQSDIILISFYLEHLLPFLFPFYRPSILGGGRAWILDMMIRSPVVRQAVLCQSSYFFSLSRELSVCNVVWDTVLTQTKEAFGVLRQALGVITEQGLEEHLHGAVRILASIMQVQRFDLAISSFENSRAHLNAALAIFTQLMEHPGVNESEQFAVRFGAIMNDLGPSAWILPTGCIQVPSSEQAAFRFSTTLLLLDDIIASTVLQEEPTLYKHHSSLLGNLNGADPLIDAESVVGCQNWVLVQIGEIAAMDAWKQQCKREGNLDVMRLVSQATAIKEALSYHLAQWQNSPMIAVEAGSGLMDFFTADHGQQSNLANRQSHVVTQIWAHAALIYLHVVVSGWQPASVDIRHHVAQVLELLVSKLSPQELLRTVVWPFCVAGCLAEPSQEGQLRELVRSLHPPSIFDTCTVRKALAIMEGVWRSRDAEDLSTRDIALCLRSQGDFILLV